MIQYYDVLTEKYVFVDKTSLLKLLKNCSKSDISEYTITDGNIYITMFNPVYHFYGINKETLEIELPHIIAAHNNEELFYNISNKKEPIIDIFEYIGNLIINIKPNFLNIEKTHF